jgi:hypothetical protein
MEDIDLTISVQVEIPLTESIELRELVQKMNKDSKKGDEDGR